MLYDKTAPKGKKQKSISTGLPVKNNKRKAEEMRKKILAEYEERGTIINCNTLFADYINEWLEVAETTVRSNTYVTYKINAETHVIPYFKELKVSLQELTPSHIQKYFTSKIKGSKDKKGLSPNTAAKHKTVINETLNLALKQGLINNNPMLRVTVPPRVEYVPSYYDAEQLQALFEKADDSVIKPAILLAATYGLRRSEVLGLAWKAINFQEKTILINKTVVKVGSANEERDVMKSKQSRRTMPLTEDIADYLAELQAR
jgi:integrase